MIAKGRQTRAGRLGVTAALVLTLGAAGCDSLLQVDLPAAVTSDALDNAGVAAIRVNSVMALFECAYSSFLMDAAGMEDNFQRVSGVAGNYSEYGTTPGGGECDTDAYSQEWIDGFQTARGMGYENDTKINGWAVDSQQELLAKNAFYTAAILDVFGEFFCEGAINESALMTPAEMLTTAETWANNAMAYVTAAGGDFPISTVQGDESASIMASLYGLRARIRWARRGGGDLAAAAADAAMVPDNHVTWVLREDGEKRRNMVSSTQGNGGGVQAAGFVQGPVKIKTTSDAYGISLLGSHPNGTAWPDPVPFTGYIDLAVDSEGRAVDNSGYPLTTASTTDVVGALTADDRVTVDIGTTAGGPDYVERKYTSLADDMPLINWKEMRLIQAEAAGMGGSATALVNSVRAADGITPISGAYQTLVESDADAFRNMIIEERRRALWLEGRFWSTKIIWNDKLWFPRAYGEWSNSSVYSLGGGVRLLLDTDEYQVNQQFADAGGLALRGTGCDPYEAPVGF